MISKFKTIYTRTGDNGITHLGNNCLISKGSQRIEVLGSIDELIAFLGLVRAALHCNKQSKELSKSIINIQNELSSLCALIANPSNQDQSSVNPFNTDYIQRLENEIDFMQLSLPHIDSFILPGSCEISSRLHVTRTVARRAERALVKLVETEHREREFIKYLNRLSHWLFIASRYIGNS